MSGNQEARIFTWRSASNVLALPYLLYLPPNYTDSSAPPNQSEQGWPLLLFLHGMGERGNDVERVTRHGLPGLIKEGQDFPFIIVSPQCPLDHMWRDQAMLETLAALLDEIARNYAVDPNRVMITGLSMGGIGTWWMIQAYPQRFAAAVPICGDGDATRAGEISHLPIWVFHGKKDTTVPFRHSEKMVAALQACGSKVRFTAYPDIGHNSWDAAYATPELYTWLLEQARQSA